MAEDDEVIALARSVTVQFDRDLVLLACWLRLSDAVFSEATTYFGADYAQVLRIRGECIDAYLQHRGFEPSALDAARKALERAEATARYLSTIPE